MHSSRVRTVRCSGRLSCHTCTRPCHVCPTCHTHSLPCMPPATHSPYYACPPTPYTPHLPRTPPPLWTEWLTDICKNITFPQLLLRTVKSFISGDDMRFFVQEFSCHTYISARYSARDSPGETFFLNFTGFCDYLSLANDLYCLTSCCDFDE